MGQRLAPILLSSSLSKMEILALSTLQKNDIPDAPTFSRNAEKKDMMISEYSQRGESTARKREKMKVLLVLGQTTRRSADPQMLHVMLAAADDLTSRRCKTCSIHQPRSPTHQKRRFGRCQSRKLEAGDNFAIIQQEILMIRECSHPNIIAYHGSYLRRDRLWIVMEYCGGGSLQDIYHMTGPLSELQIAFVCRETLKGLDYLHKMGKVHRDIKGANILLTHAGDVKLADFGVAAQITATIGKRKSFIGTPYWMAPEVACVERRGGYGVQCDVWAVGITAIELAECQPPSFDLHPMQVLYLMTRSSYKPPHLKEKHRWSPLFHDFVRQCLTKNPKKRPTPDKLLSAHHFVLGSLSSRMTRDLLDKVNNGSSARLIQRRLQEDDDRDSGEDDEETSTHPQDASSVRSSLSSRSDRSRLRDSVSHSREATPSSMSSSSSVSCRGGGFHSDRTLPARDLPPLPDVVSGDALLHDGNGVIEDDCGTLVAPYAPPRTLRAAHNTMQHRSTSLENSDAVRLRAIPNIEIERPKTYFGMPVTPKVVMGACFTKMVHECSLRINCASSWIHPGTGAQLLLLGCEEGIYAVDTNKLHDGELTKVCVFECLLEVQISVEEDASSAVFLASCTSRCLMAMQGKTSYLYRHDLVALSQKNLTLRISKPINKMPEKYIPRKLAITVRLPETKGALQCTTSRGEGTQAGATFLCCCIPSSVLLFQWYEPLNKFLLVRSAELDAETRFPLSPFKLINTRTDFPQLCVGVQATGSTDKYEFEWIKFGDRKQEVPSGKETPDVTQIDGLKLSVVAMLQIGKDSVLFAYRNKVVITNLEGYEKTKLAVFTFNFHIEYVHCMSDSILAFHSHGVQVSSKSEKVFKAQSDN
ncbi:hypothetical protein KIN20_029943 [Parelaphostrongylus tenuis]|uniref:Mitogen-activated protein kinase kinase kinase kinase n=1 Tax=Parelaphostrongylus tenuis TaxID=148309 RepID=A0AAD5WFZ8_PARTN|nr:hypothetical protein KIN20_029943 [Parelaphostrongylus tenuis]